MGTRFRRTPAFLAVLHVLAKGEATYGWEICKHTGLPGSTVYALLARFEAQGWVTSRWGGPEAPRRRMYEMTAEGRKAIGIGGPVSPDLYRYYIRERVMRDKPDTAGLHSAR